ncbi:E3 ubiquitin-protein ligase DZIP3-like [Ruditapes philippinarum]|uniref:E3 ubiquitin-protein ligase DZIP3-like n=1 Tax=Ruditapes philippinarum TaxID=129788 RepID=UPI00295B63CF|nr:E3 ubiquitin-protein ligase DZIP3-like [Ruditapes philippinarum]
MATCGKTYTSKNRVYLFRLQILIIDGGLLVLRNILDQTLASKGITLSVCLNQEKPTITRLKSRGNITQVQYDQLFPTVARVPTSSDMDITLIICLLRSLKCFGLNKKFDWNTTPKSTDVTIEADMYRLKAFRNKISHISKTTVIQPNEFVTMWNDIEQILVRLSSPALNIQQKIADFKTCTLDPEEEKRVQEEIKKWKDYEADVDRLKEEMTDVKERVTEVEKNQEEIKRRVAEDKSYEGRQAKEEKYQKRKKRT